MSLLDPLSRHATATPSRPALQCAGVTVPYAALDRLASRAAGALRARGVGRGDRVALLLPNGIDFVVAYLGARRAGAIPTSVSPIWGQDAIDAALADADPALVVTSRASHAGLDAGLRVLLADAPLDDPLSLHDALARARPMSHAGPRAPGDAAAILYTSGTTGVPKGVVLTEQNLATNAARKAECCGIGAGDRVALFVPLCHVFGQNAILNATLAAGGCVVLYERFDEGLVAADIAAGRLTMLFGAPTALPRLLDAGVGRETRGALRYVLTAAAPIAAGERERWESATGLVVHEGYGLTESSPFAAYNHRERVVPGSVGTAIDGVTIAALDERGAPLPPGEPGELGVRGPNVMAGYWRRPELTARALRGGWLHTGDVGLLDENGYVFLRGRVDDVINVSGFKVWPEEVERIAREVAGVAEAAAWGARDGARGERVELAVVPREPALADPESFAVAVLAAIAPRLAPYQRPARVHVRGALPRTASGKVLRRALREALPVSTTS